MTPNPRLVEALAFMVREADSVEDAERVVRRFFATHRLVQLPEEPSGWEVEWRVDLENGSDGPCFGSRGWAQKPQAVDAAQTPYATGRIRPVYIIPGDPQEVDDGS